MPRCEVCDRSFKEQGAYDRHVKKVHGGRAPRNRNKRLAVAAGVVVVLAALVFAFGPERTPADPSDLEERFHLSSSPRLESPSAGEDLVTLVAFEGPGCPSCRIFHVGLAGREPAFERIKSTYIETGRIRYVEKTFFIGEPNERVGASAQRCVWHASPDKFFDLTKAFYRDQSRLFAHGVPEREVLDFVHSWAVSVGLDGAAIADCAARNPHASELSQDVRDGRDEGVSGTPSFLVVARDGSTQKIVGAQPWETFADAIEEALAV